MKKYKVIIGIICIIAVTLSLTPIPNLITAKVSPLVYGDNDQILGPFEYGDYEYIIYDYPFRPFRDVGIALTSYRGNESEPVIPDKINGIPVVALGYGDNGTFKNCTRITDIVIPEGVRIIGTGTFAGCTNLKSICIPSSIDTITNYDGSLFAGCKNLKSLSVDPDNKYYISEDDILFMKNNINNKTWLEFYPPGKPGEKYTVPNGVKEINSYAFADCSNLRKIIFPDGLERLDEGIIDGCNNLKEIVIPDSVKFIGKVLSKSKPITVYGYKYSYAIAKAKEEKQLYKYININKPESLKAVSSKGTVKLTWSESSNATGYEVWRYDNSTRKYQIVTTTNSKDKTEITDKKVIKKRTYRFDVRSFRMVNSHKVLSNHKTTLQVSVK